MTHVRGTCINICADVKREYEKPMVDSNRNMRFRCQHTLDYTSMCNSATALGGRYTRLQQSTNDRGMHRRLRNRRSWMHQRVTDSIPVQVRPSPENPSLQTQVKLSDGGGRSMQVALALHAKVVHALRSATCQLELIIDQHTPWQDVAPKISPVSHSYSVT